MSSNTPRLTMRGIRKSFGSTIALANVDLEIQAGEVHALVGENGAGKSTLMKVLSGAHHPDAGEILLDGVVYSPKNPLHARTLGVGMIYQELSIVPHLTVEENIVLGMEPTCGLFVQRKAMREKALSALSRFGLDHIRPDTIAGELSVSAQQMVEIGRSLAMGCRVLVFDEPTSSLGQKDIAKLFTLIDSLRDSGISIIYISHFLEEVKRLSSRLTILRDGTSVATLPTHSTSAENIVSLMVGRDVKDLYPRSERTRGEILLECDKLHGHNKPSGASLTVHRGEVIGIAGLVGSGRTEFLRTLFSLDPVTTGKIHIQKIESTHANPSTRWKQGIGMLSENRKEEGLALNLSITDNINLSSLEKKSKFGFIQPNNLTEKSKHWITSLGIKCASASQPIGALSGGNQQKAALARLLEHDVDIFLLDEPTRGIDIAAKARIYEVINEIVTHPSEPKSVIMISSYLPELFGICDRISVMSRGKLSPPIPVSQTSPEEIMKIATQ